MLTRRDIIIKWSTYSAASQLLVALFTLTLRETAFFGVHLFLPPLIVGVVASLENTRAGAIFALGCGVLCDLTLCATFPCLYTVAFTLAALSCSFLATNVLQPGVLCSLAVSALTFAYVDALNMIALFLRARAPFGVMADIALRETLLSCAMLVVCHPVYTFLHRKFTL